MLIRGVEESGAAVTCYVLGFDGVDGMVDGVDEFVGEDGFVVFVECC